MTSHEPRLITIVGGGVIALLTAVDCVSAGHRVVLVDQAEIPFSGATSFDRHRVIHALHPDPATAVAAGRAHALWLRLQDRLTTRIYERIGVLTALAPDEQARAMAVLTAAGAPARALSAGELAARHPQVRFPPGFGGVFEPHTGVLLADRILAGCAGWLRWHSPAELHQHRRAVEIDPARAAVRLADGAVLRSDAVLVAAGPWSRALLPPELAARLELHRTSMIYCDVPAPLSGAWTGSPVLRGLGPSGRGWLVPPVAGAPLKLSDPAAGRVVAEIDGIGTPPAVRDRLVDTFAGVVPGLRADWLIDTRDCYYLAQNESRGPMLALLSDRVVGYAACGGTSFKFAPLIARCLFEHLTGAPVGRTGLEPLDHPARNRPVRSVL